MRPEPRRGRRRIRTASVRVRATAAAVLVVAVATSAGAALLLVVLRGLLTDELAAAAYSRAEQIASDLPPGVTGAALPTGDFEDDVAQLVAHDATVVAASPNAAGHPPFTWPPSDEPAEVAGPVGSAPLIVMAYSMDDGRVLLVGRTVDSRDDALLFVAELLAVGLPVLLVIVALLTWLTVGRALRPVEDIRREVDEVSSMALDRRVPEPPSEDEIARLARTMNRMLDRLEAAQLTQRRFTSDASHELRSPVAAIRQCAEVALAHPDRTTVSRLARTVLDEDLRVQHVVEDLLLLARVDEHSLRLRTASVDLDDIVFAEARRLRESTGLRVDTTGVSAGRVQGDADALQRVLRNLGENAARHARTWIRFALAGTGVGVELTVDDDGPGIPRADRARVLQRFVRLDDARDRDHGGSGLGLAIVDELVAAHGAALAIGDSPGGGARVRLTFPPLLP